MVQIVKRILNGFTTSFPRDSEVKINLLHCTSPKSEPESQHFYVTQRQEELQTLGGVGYFTSVLRKERE